MTVLQRRILVHESNRERFEMALHGAEYKDGGAAGSGLDTPPVAGGADSQGPGSSAWQQALKMGMEVNARKRRN